VKFLSKNRQLKETVKITANNNIQHGYLKKLAVNVVSCWWLDKADNSRSQHTECSAIWM